MMMMMMMMMIMMGTVSLKNHKHPTIRWGRGSLSVSKWPRSSCWTLCKARCAGQRESVLGEGETSCQRPPKLVFVDLFFPSSSCYQVNYMISTDKREWNPQNIIIESVQSKNKDTILVPSMVFRSFASANERVSFELTLKDALWSLGRFVGRMIGGRFLTTSQDSLDISRDAILLWGFLLTQKKPCNLCRSVFFCIEKIVSPDGKR